MKLKNLCNLEQNEGKKQMEMTKLGAGMSYLRAYSGELGPEEADLPWSPGSLWIWRHRYGRGWRGRGCREREEVEAGRSFESQEEESLDSQLLTPPSPTTNSPHPPAVLRAWTNSQVPGMRRVAMGGPATRLRGIHLRFAHRPLRQLAPCSFPVPERQQAGLHSWSGNWRSLR